MGDYADGSSGDEESVEAEEAEDDELLGDDDMEDDGPQSLAASGPSAEPSLPLSEEASDPWELRTATAALERLTAELAAVEDFDAVPGALRCAIDLCEDPSFLQKLFAKDGVDLGLYARFLKTYGVMLLEVHSVQKKKDRLDIVKELEADIEQLRAELRGLRG
jgi:hypothetical protein